MADVRGELLRSGLLSEERVDRFARAGHFVYESGDHGDTWLDLDVLFWEPARLRAVVDRFAPKLKQHNPEIVVGPAVGGALAAQIFAESMKIAFAYTERFGRVGNIRYAIPSGARGQIHGKRALIVDDVINAGSATLATLDEVRSCGGVPVAVAAFMIRSAGRADVAAKAGVPVETVMALDWNIWKAAQCPVCET